MSPSDSPADTKLVRITDTPAPPSLLALECLNPLPNGIFTSIDNTKAEGKLKLYQAIMGESFDLADVTGKEIQVCDVVVHPAETPNEKTGGMDLWTRVALIGPGLEIIGCGSKGVLKSLVVYSATYGKPPWNPPARFIVRSKNIGQKRWCWLDLSAAMIDPKK